MPAKNNLHTSVFHSLEDCIAVLDQDGNILEVNQAWEQFGAKNGQSPEYQPIGQNYFQVLSNFVASDGSTGEEICHSIKRVFSKHLDSYDFEFPCHSPDEQRWFRARVSPMIRDDIDNLFLIRFQNITFSKLAMQQIEKLAMQDPLTELSNRRAFDQFFSWQLRLCTRSQIPIGLILVDLDHFKEYNDTFGHSEGDRCLIAISKILMRHTRRPTDLATRYGGDEFALVFGETSTEMVTTVANSIAEAVNTMNFKGAISRKVTVSIGFLCVIPNRLDKEDSLIQAADKALYEAKAKGRNQIVHAQRPISA